MLDEPITRPQLLHRRCFFFHLIMDLKHVQLKNASSPSSTTQKGRWGGGRGNTTQSSTARKQRGEKQHQPRGDSSTTPKKHRKAAPQKEGWERSTAKNEEGIPPLEFDFHFYFHTVFTFFKLFYSLFLDFLFFSKNIFDLFYFSFLSFLTCYLFPLIFDF